jgi:hypothetical protein
MGRLLTLFTKLFTAAVITVALTSCSLFNDGQEKLPGLPPKVVSDEAEKTLDDLLDDRFSKAAASVNAIKKVVSQEPDSNKKSVILAEAKIAKTLLGDATQVDENEALERVKAVLAGGSLVDSYGKYQQEAEDLKAKMKEADAAYESERAKAKAEYEAKIAERDQLLEQQKQLRRIDAEEARKDKFMLLGAALITIGILVSIFLSKHDGLLLMVGGVAVASFGWILGTPYFYWIVVTMAILGIIRGVIYLYPRKTQAVTPPATTNESSSSEPKS